jgi:hypothetical protein
MTRRQTMKRLVPRAPRRPKPPKQPDPGESLIQERLTPLIEAHPARPGQAHGPARSRLRRPWAARNPL